MLLHTLGRLNTEYGAVLRAVRDGSIKLPQPKGHITTPGAAKTLQDKGEAPLNVGHILGNGRTWPLMVQTRNGVISYSLATPADILSAEVRDGTNIVHLGVLAAISLVVYGLIAIVLSSGWFGPLVVVVPAILIDAVLFLMLAPFMGTRGTDGTSAWALLKSQVRQSWLAQAAIWYSLIGATLAAGLPSVLAVLIGIVATVRLKRVKSQHPGQSGNPVLFDQTLKTGIVFAAIATLLIGSIAFNAQHGDTGLGFSLLRFQGLSSIAVFVLLAPLYAAGAWMLSARVLIVQAVRFRAEMVYWAKTELLKHGQQPTDSLAQQLLTEHRDVALDEFAADFRTAALAPEFVELADRTRSGYSANQTPLEANIGGSFIALLCPVTPLWIIAARNAARAEERAIIEQALRKWKTSDAATSDAEKFAAVHGQEKQDVERGLDIVK
jgi:hypothetical protein